MIRDKSFWEKEKDAPLLDKNAGYITYESAEKVISRASCLLKLIEKREETEDDKKKKEEIVDLPPDISRIFVLDAERTFKDEGNRQKMIMTLTEIWKEIRDYHQGLGFVVAFLLLFFPPKDVINIAISLNYQYTPGYFMSRAYNYFKDAKVHFKLLEEHFPLFAKHLENKCISPEAYCSKLFVGLCVHILPFEQLLYFLECYFERNYIFLFQFSLALVKVCEHDLLSSNDVSRIFAILRLDESIYPLQKSLNCDNSHNYVLHDENSNNDGSKNAQVHPNENCSKDKFSQKLEPEEPENHTKRNSQSSNFFRKIIDEALVFKLSKANVEKLREEAAEEMRIEEENKKLREAEIFFDSDDEIVFSDEENEKREAENS